VSGYGRSDGTETNPSEEPQLVMQDTAKQKGGLMKILLVDDDEECLKALQMMLTAMDYDCIASSDPREALNHFALHSFNLIITDFRMPFMTGGELARKIRDINADVKIILISGYLPHVESVNDSLFNAFLEKPVNISELKSVLDSL